MRCWLPLLFSLFFVGCKGVEYHVLELPGFSVEVPTQVAFTSDPKTQYRTGRVEARIGATFVSVGWQVGAPVTLEEAPAMAKMIAAVFPSGGEVAVTPARTVKVNGHQATWIDAKIDKIDLSIIDIACGRRSVMLGIGSGRGFEEMRTRILNSFTCKPIDADELAIATAVPIGVDDPKVLEGWFRVPDDESLMLSNGSLVAMFVEVPPAAIGGKAFERLLPMMFSTLGGTWSPSRSVKRQAIDGEREVHFGTLTMDGEAIPTVVTLWTCDGAGKMLMAVVMASDDSDLASGADFLTQLRCEKSGDAPLPLSPTPDDELEADE